MRYFDFLKTRIPFVNNAHIDQTKVFEKAHFLRRHPGNNLKRRDLKLFGPPRATLKTKTANFQASSSSEKWFSR